jgi:hypothetical protein
LGYASLDDEGISVGDISAAPVGTGVEVPFLGPASVLSGASVSAGVEVVLVLGPASNLSGASASTGVEVVLVLGFSFGTPL